MSQLTEYCDHCAKKHGFKNSFIGFAKPGSFAQVVCTGCGITTVDQHGNCLKCKPKFSVSQIFILLLVIVLGILVLMKFI